MVSGGRYDQSMAPKRSSCEGIVEEVRELLLSPEGREKIEHRRAHAKKLAEGLRRWNELKSGRMRRRGAVLTVTQGALEKALSRRRVLQVSVEVNGVGVGKIQFSSQHRPIFIASDPGSKLEWSGNARDGAMINAYLEKCRSRKSMPERHVQGDMSARFRALFEDNNKPPGGLVPVRPAGCMMEIPTAVAASSTLKVGGGAIDILARTGRGRTGWFVACELKKPDSSEHVYDVLRQAIRYATALDVEVNGFGALPPAEPDVYRELFGGTGSARPRFGALAAVSALQHEQVSDALLALAPPKNSWIGTLLYQQEAHRLRAVVARHGRGER